MAHMDPEQIVSKTVAMIDSILADLASGRTDWSSPETFLSLGRDIAPFSFRLSEDSTNLAAVSVGDVRDGIVNDLGSDGYTYLIGIPSSAREEIAETMLDVETGGCAAESYRMPQAIDRSFVDRLPLPLPYMIAWVAPRIYRPETLSLVSRLMDDVRAGRSAWDSMAGTEPAAMPQLLRNVYLGLLAQAARPRDIRDKLESLVGSRAFSQLINLDEPGSAELADSVYRDVNNLHRPSSIDDLSGRDPDLPDIFIAVASWGARQFRRQDMDVITRAILADVAARSGAWQQLDVIAAERLSPLADRVVSGITETSPARMHERLLARLGAECLDKILTLPDEECTRLGNSLYLAAMPPPSWRTGPPRLPGEPNDIEDDFDRWCQRWCSSDR